MEKVATPVVVSKVAVAVPTRAPVPLTWVMDAVTVPDTPTITWPCAFFMVTAGWVVNAAPDAVPTELVVSTNCVGVAPSATEAADTIDAGPVLPAASATEFADSLATMLPSPVQATVTVNELPLDASGVKVHDVAVPVYEKSLLLSPLTDSLNTRVRSKVRAVYDVALDEKVETVGAVVSMMTESVERVDRLPAGSTPYA